MTRPDRESRFDDVDLASLTIVELEDYLSGIVDRHVIIPDPFFARAYELRIVEVQGQIQREVAIRNRRETERQDGMSPSPVPAGGVPAAALHAAVEALGDVMLEMQRRALMARGMRNEEWAAILKRSALTDQQLGERAIAAFQAGAEALIQAGHIVPTKEADHG